MPRAAQPATNWRRVSASGRIMLGSLRQLPEAQRIVGIARQGPSSVCRESDTEDGALVPLEAAQLLTPDEFPEPERLVDGAGDKPGIIRRQGHGVDASAVARERPQLLAGLDVTQADARIALMTGNKLLAIVGQGQATAGELQLQAALDLLAR